MSIGNLYIVATPIGNLDDITLRALKVLNKVDIVAAEDTRHSRKLFDAHGIQARLWSLHDHNEEAKSTFIIESLLEGKDMALISDAGTPLISDPGYRLVKLAQDAGIQVLTVPGPCAAIAALSISGLPTDSFMFEGFLPAKSAGRRQALEKLKKSTSTAIFYESPRRITDLLNDIANVLGESRLVCVAKELTKTYERVISAPVADVIAEFKCTPSIERGEFVVLIAGISRQALKEVGVDAETLKLIQIARGHMPLKQACALVEEMTGIKKKRLYNAALDT